MPNPLSSSADSEAKASFVESRIVLGLILLTIFLTSLPYLLGYFITPPGTQFVGTVYNIDDYCNYLSWLRQTMDGHFFLRSLFTTDPQKGLEFNVFFWLLGLLAHLLHLSPQAALQVARVGGGLALLVLIYRFYRYVLPADVPARLTAFGFACLGSGFGWVTWAHWHDKNLPGSPVDAWQPEAFTFLTLYTSALMTVSTVLILGALYALLLGEQTEKWRYPVIAGIFGAILGNMHSYDVLHLSAAWGLFLVVWTVLKRGRGVTLSWARALLALGLTLPTTIYQYLVFQHEAVFRQRANTPTLSPYWIVSGKHPAILLRHKHLQIILLSDWHFPVVPYFVGYGLLLLLALVAVFIIARKVLLTPNNGRAGEKEETTYTSPLPAAGRPILFTVCWAVAGLLVIYLPVAFQRKMIMGEHIPLCLLAGIGAALLVRPLATRQQRALLALIVLLSTPSNLLFLRRDMTHLEGDSSETQQFPFLSKTLVATFDWVAANAPPDSAVVGLPPLCAYLPGYADHPVWAGHWAETPHYVQRFADFLHFSDSRTSDEERKAFLKNTHAQYLLYANDLTGGYVSRDGEARQYADLVRATPAYLIPVYRNKDYTLFRINIGK